MANYLHRVHWPLRAGQSLYSVHRARMGDDKSQRLDDALSSLVDQLIPISQDDDEVAIEERREEALHSARTILEG